jgi:hypothetical protein
MWLWAEPLRKRSGAVSVWGSERDLMRFVRWPVHVEIMRRYRARGTLTSTHWDTERFVAHEVWREAVSHLAGGEILAGVREGGHAR